MKPKKDLELIVSLRDRQTKIGGAKGHGYAVASSTGVTTTSLVKIAVANVKQHFTKQGSYQLYPDRQFLQSSVVKVSYSSNKHDGQWRAHGRYLAREGAQLEDRKGLGFSESEEDIDIADTLASWQKSGDERVYRVIVSPAQGHKLDLHEHGRALMHNVEKDFARKLEWIAIPHTNTDNHHIHLLIRGVDASGQSIWIDKSYIQRGFRRRSQEAATRKLGFQLKEDVLERHRRSIEAIRVTQLDREIVNTLDENKRISMNIPDQETAYQKEKRRCVIGRLQFLESMKFAEKTGAITWSVSPDLLNGLKTFQINQDIIKRKSNHMAAITDPGLKLAYTKLKPGEHVVGRVVGFGLHDEFHDKRYLLIEGVDNIHYLNPPRKLVMSRDAGDIRNGDILFLEVKTFTDKKTKKDVSYLRFENWGALGKLNQKNTDESDRYILNEISRDPRVLKNTGSPKTFRNDFYAWMRTRAGQLNHRIAIHAKDLRRTPDVIRVYRQALDAKWITHSDANLVRFVAATVTARETQGSSVKNFIDIVRNKRWYKITHAHEDRAVQAISRHRKTHPEAFDFLPVRAMNQKDSTPIQAKREIDTMVRNLSKSVSLKFH